MRRFFSILLLLPFLICLPAFAKSSSSTAKTSTATRALAQSDAQIDATIRAKLAKSKIGKDGFKYHVQHGVVTWEGNTGVMQHKGSATRMAKAAGATQVVNHIQVSANARAKAASNLQKAQVSN